MLGRFSKSLFSGRMLVAFMMGFSCGLPLALTGGTLKAWMKDQNVDLTVIGLFALVGTPYSLKFLWAPILDRFSIPGFGRRRGWLLVTQSCILIGLWILSRMDPTSMTFQVALVCLGIAFFSASQDTVVDAYRRETLADDELGMGSGLYIAAYRVAFQFVGGALALILADHLPWSDVYKLMACVSLVGIITTLFSPEPEVTESPRTLRAAAIEPFTDFFKRMDWGLVFILAFILLYKIGDTMASEITIPFYLDIGFTKTEIGLIGKTVGLTGYLVGGLIGGGLVLKWGINRSLWIFGFFQAISTFGFVLLANFKIFSSPIGLDLYALGGVIGFESLTGGMGGSAFIAYMMSLTNRKFTATQYALLSSLMSVPRTFAAAPTGWIAKTFGWSFFFTFCTLIAIPGILLLFKIAPWNTKNES